MLNSHGSNSEVRLTTADTTLFKFGFQYTENAAALPVKREDIYVWENHLLKGLQYLLLSGTPVGTVVNFPNINGTCVLKSFGSLL